MSIFDYRDIEKNDLEKHLHISEFTEGDANSRETKKLPTYQNETLRFVSPWMFCKFGWGGKYDLLTLQSSSKANFPLENKQDKDQFREFLNNIGNVIENHVNELPNPNNLNTSLTKPFSYDEKYHYYKFTLGLPKRHFDADGEFEGNVYKSTDPKIPEMKKTSIKALQPNTFVQFVGYLGHIVQTRNCIRYHIVVQELHFMPADPYIQKTEEEKVSSNTNFFLNVPSLKKKRNINVDIEYNNNKTNKNDDDDENIEDLSESSKKTKKTKIETK